MHHTRFHHTNSLICLLLTLLCIQILIDHVCAFVECNQVPWLDLHSRPMKFKRDAILMEVMISIDCFRCKEKYNAVQDGNKINETVESSYYLLAIFDAVMNTMTKANKKKVGLACGLVDRLHLVTYRYRLYLFYSFVDLDVQIREFTFSHSSPTHLSPNDLTYFSIHRWECHSFMTSYYRSMARKDSGISTWFVTLVMSAYPS